MQCTGWCDVTDSAHPCPATARGRPSGAVRYEMALALSGGAVSLSRPNLARSTGSERELALALDAENLDTLPPAPRNATCVGAEALDLGSALPQNDGCLTSASPPPSMATIAASLKTRKAET
jgi:hypothetical protein